MAAFAWTTTLPHTSVGPGVVVSSCNGLAEKAADEKTAVVMTTATSTRTTTRA